MTKAKLSLKTLGNELTSANDYVFKLLTPVSPKEQTMDTPKLQEVSEKNKIVVGENEFRLHHVQNAAEQ